MSQNESLRRLAMARSIETERLLEELTSVLDSLWLVAWDELTPEANALISRMTQLASENELWPTRAQLRRLPEMDRFLKSAEAQLKVLQRGSAQELQEPLEKLLENLSAWDERLVKSQLPPNEPPIAWNRLDENAIRSIKAQMSTSFLTTSALLPSDQLAVIRTALIRGVAMGENPNEVAKAMYKLLRKSFDGGLARLKTIARTEMLDAYRDADLLTRDLNKDVLKGWRWTATLSDRTCPACLALDGTIYPYDEPGPLGHQNCRCTAVPVTKTWAELGFRHRELPDAIQTGREWVESQPAKVQQQILGAERYLRVKNGTLSWNDIPKRISTPGWRDSFVTRSLLDSNAA